MDCTPVALPKVKADFCAPDFNFGQISALYLGNSDRTDFANWDVITEWTANLDNTDVTTEKIKTLHVIGDKPAPERNSIAFSQGREVSTPAKHTVNVKVDETHDDNYALVQWLENNVGQQIKAWYAAGKYLYGGNSGISVTLTLDDVIPESKEELNTFVGAIKWEGSHPDRVVSPLT